MAKYLLLESRDPFEYATVKEQYDLAAALAKEGNTVTLFLIQNGVLPARPTPMSEPLAAIAKAGVQVLADEFSLRERGIGADRLATGVQQAPLDRVLDLLGDGCKALWH